MTDITRILERVRSGDPGAPDDLLEQVYLELRTQAAARMAREAPGQTLQATALVHEAWLRLGGDHQPAWQSRAHFFSAAAEAMRRILVDRARRRHVRARAGVHVPSEETPPEVVAPIPRAELLDVHEVLDHLAQVDRQAAELVKLRHFVGLEMTEAAEVLGLGLRQTERLWTFARAWLRDAIRRNSPGTR